MIEIKFTPDSNDIIRIAKRKQLRLLRFIYPACILVLILWDLPGLRTGDQSLLEIIISQLPALVVIIIMIEVFWPMLIKRNLQKLTSWGHPVQYIFGEDQIQQRSRHTDSTLQWQSLSRAEIIGDQLLLYLGPKNAYIQIPDRAFFNVRQREQLIDLLRRKHLF